MPLTEIELIQNLASEPSAHNKALAFLFTARLYKDPVVSYLKSKGLTNDECNILWTDIIVKFGLLVKKGKYVHQGKLEGYLKNLAGYVMLNYFRSSKKHHTDELTDQLTKDVAVEHATSNHQELKILINHQLSKIGENCKEILSLWAQDYSMGEIMAKMKIISVEATRKRKHICLSKLLDNIANDQNVSKLFKEYYYE